jgi:hypothetical protein
MIFYISICLKVVSVVVVFMISKAVNFNFSFFRPFLIFVFCMFSSFAQCGDSWGWKKWLCKDSLTNYFLDCKNKPEGDIRQPTIIMCTGYVGGECSETKCIDAIGHRCIEAKDIAVDVIDEGIEVCNQTAKYLKVHSDILQNKSTECVGPTKMYTVSYMEGTDKPTPTEYTPHDSSPALTEPTSLYPSKETTTRFSPTTESPLASSPTNITDINSSFTSNHSMNVHPTDVSTTEMVRDVLEYTKDLGVDAVSTVYTDLSDWLSTTLAAQDDDDDSGLNLKIAMIAGGSVLTALAAGATIYSVYQCRKQKKCCFKDLEAPPAAHFNLTRFDGNEGGGEFLTGNGKDQLLPNKDRFE